MWYSVVLIIVPEYVLLCGVDYGTLVCGTLWC